MIPALIITGFLGSGKTTLLNRLIRHNQGKRTVVLVNEFGSINIDSAILVDGDYEKVEVNRGSLFCVCVRKDLLQALGEIAEHLRPELLIIEATGLADTSEMESILALPQVRDRIRLKACVCLVDSVNFIKIRDNLRVPVTQVKSADLVLINKVDLVDANRLKETVESVRTLAGDSRILETVQAEFDLALLDGIVRRHSDSGRPPGEGRPDAFQTVTLEGEGSLSREAWERLKDSFGDPVHRVKGFITVDQKPVYIEATMGEWQVSPANRTESCVNRLVIIGRELDEAVIRKTFSAQLTESY